MVQAQEGKIQQHKLYKIGQVKSLLNEFEWNLPSEFTQNSENQFLFQPVKLSCFQVNHYLGLVL